MIRDRCEAIGKFCLEELEEWPGLGVQRGVVENNIRVVGEQRQDHGSTYALALAFFRDFDPAESSVGFREHFEIDLRQRISGRRGRRWFSFAWCVGGI